MTRWLVLCITHSIASALPAADWPTHRGNPQRTGNVDGQAGPKSPKVLWVHHSTQHYIASPVAGEKALYVSGLGAFNASALQATSYDPSAKDDDRTAWSKGAPYLKRPTVSPPAVIGGLVIFGDGMHQTSGALLHGLRADDGFALWQYRIDGELVHLEGAPTVADGKLYMGGGNAGVFCLDLKRIEVDGKEMDPAAAAKAIDAEWKKLLAKYEVDKRKDPDFAMAPTEENLPKTQPKLVWQQGRERWHVDASVNVAEGKVLVGSAFLDEEKIGDRAVYCLNAADGKEAWRAALKHNPWGGATFAKSDTGDLVIVGCSNIRFDPKELPRGQGEVIAFSLKDGTEKWKRPVAKGGVLSPVAVSGTWAVFTSTDGKMRGVEVGNGRLAWTYDGKAPFFAAPAIAGDVAYSADLNGVVHAVNLANGTKLWTLDLANDAAVKSPGSVYGSPIVHGGRLYVATSNLDTPARKGTVLVCIGEK
ncbi:MAG: PQQ-binding-like beta-propeller repeat protein [Planctomycetaceae bacterium]|nr:PQQ-binding-like beta-propeller repeat protein [Planctomycetaceae bacterium]